MKTWDDKAFQQSSGKLISDQSKKNTGNLDIIEIMKIIHKPYPLNEFDKESIEKEYKKMYDYFFPNNKVMISRRKKNQDFSKKNQGLQKKKNQNRPKKKNYNFPKKDEVNNMIK